MNLAFTGAIPLVLSLNSVWIVLKTSDWTDERIALLKQLWTRNGLSAGQIAARLGGVTRNAVIGKVHRLGLVQPYSPPTKKRLATRRRKSRAPRKPKAEAEPACLAPDIAPRLDLPSEPLPKRFKIKLPPLIRVAGGGTYRPEAPPPPPKLPDLRRKVPKSNLYFSRHYRGNFEL